MCHCARKNLSRAQTSQADLSSKLHKTIDEVQRRSRSNK